MAAEESIQQRKRRLALGLDASRGRLTASGRDLRRRLNPVRAAGRYLRRHPVQVFAGTAAGTALLTYLLKPRSSERKKRKSLPRRLFGWTFSFATPAFRLWLLKQAKTYLQQPADSSSTDSLLGP